MKNLIKWTSDNPYQREVDFVLWSIEQTKRYWAGTLDEEIKDALDSIGFDWHRFKRNKL